MRYIDLHAHLGASTPADILWDLAVESGINVGTKDYFQFIENMLVPNTLVHKAYLNKFHLSQSIQSSLQGIERSMYHAVSHAFKKLGLERIELRFNPALRNLNKRYDIDAVIYHATFGMKKAMLAFPIKAGIIIETDRTFDLETAKILAKKAVEFRNEGIVGFDMSGFTPSGFSLKTFEPAFSIAKAGGLGITVHAGELRGHGHEVTDAIEYLYADRIGHGIQIFNDDDALRLAADNKTHFEFCPTSNVMTGCVDSFESYMDIITRFNEFGVSWNLNTDGSEFLGVSVEEEHRRVGLSPKDEEKVKANVLAASFIK